MLMVESVSVPLLRSPLMKKVAEDAPQMTSNKSHEQSKEGNQNRGIAQGQGDGATIDRSFCPIHPRSCVDGDIRSHVVNHFC